MRNHGEEAPKAAAELIAAAEELYALPPAEFTGTRNDCAKALAQRDKSLAGQVRRLPKPSAAAWAVNMLARRRPDEIAGILALGASLREAQHTLNRDELQRLGRERQTLIAAVARRAGDLARELGAPISDSAAVEVAQTLQAALADPEAALAVQSGRLVRALASTGFEPPDLSGAVAGAVAGSVAAPVAGAIAAPVAGAIAAPRTGATTSVESAQDARRSEREAARAQRALALAESRSAAAEAELRAVEGRQADLVLRREQLEGELDALQDRAAALARDLAATATDARSLARDRDRASREAAEAGRAVARAREALG